MKGEVHPKYIVVLCCSAIAVLAAGLWLKPEKREKQARSPSETATLQRIVRRQQVDNIAEVIAQAAMDASNSLVRERGATGVLWGEQVLIPPRDPATLPFSLMKAQTPAKPQISTVIEGWTVLVAYAEDGRLVWIPVTSGGVVTKTCHEVEVRTFSLPAVVGARYAGGGLFDLDGRIAGIVADCEGRHEVIEASEIDKIVELINHPEMQTRQQFGVELQEVERGSRIRSIWVGGIGDRAGLRVGDILQAPLETLLEASGVPSPVIRNGRRVLLDLTKLAPVAASNQGVSLVNVDEGSAAYRAGLREGDAIVQVGTERNPSADQVERALASIRRPLFVIYRRGEVRRGVTISGE